MGKSEKEKSNTVLSIEEITEDSEEATMESDQHSVPIQQPIIYHFPRQHQE